ncbi:c-type cytochrome [Candidatus Halocynthiibacter alkanivorans]|uniref:c-type cytochrome n=1 Tax=Candidatus Halocynthiibacter alkanivorans TaxID=2267619 RepID=UPI001F2CFBD7|nr:c-type cytochrome [Candidatus Halocynthiibacter alkanivorans]
MSPKFYTVQERDMFDTMTLTKILGAFCGALLLFLFANWAGTTLYTVGAGEHSYHNEEVAQGYVIEVEETEASEAEVEEQIDFAALVAEADALKGSKVFAKCKACHSLEAGKNTTGPTLFGVVGRDIGSVAGYSYSAAVEELEGLWGEEELNGFLEKPKSYLPGTKMGFGGLKKVSDRANLVAYLATIGG